MKKEPFKISVNGQYEFSVQPEEARNLDIIPNHDQAFHLLHKDVAYHIELLEADYANRTFTLRIGGAKYPVNIADY